MPSRVAEGDRGLEAAAPERLVDVAVVAASPSAARSASGREKRARPSRRWCGPEDAHHLAAVGVGVERRRSGRSTDGRGADALRRARKSRRRSSAMRDLRHEALVYNSCMIRRARRRPRGLRVEGSAQADARRARRRLARLRHHLDRLGRLPRLRRAGRPRRGRRATPIAASWCAAAASAWRSPPTRCRGIRAAPIWRSGRQPLLAREHNDLNVLTLAGRQVAPDAAAAIVDAFLSTPFAGGRHEPRIAKIRELERDTAPSRRA